MPYLKTIKTDELPSGKMRRVELAGHELLIANIGGRFYAMDNRCGHMNGSLAMGKLNGNIVECPLHRAKYDVTSGKCVQLPQMGGLEGMFVAATGAGKVVSQIDTLDLRTYRTRTEKGILMVDIPDCPT